MGDHAVNVLTGDTALADWRSLATTSALLLDVREPAEFASGHIAAAINIPLSQLRRRYAELPREREIWIYCGVGQRAYFATRFLAMHGYHTRNLSGGYETYKAFAALPG
jgi:rhodanese-related sulfurtransferase